MGSAEKAQLLGRARDIANKASSLEQPWAWAALALSGEAEDFSRASTATEGKDAPRAQLVANLAKLDLLREAQSAYDGLTKPSARGCAALSLAAKAPALSLDGLPPRFAAPIALQLAARGLPVDLQVLARLRERAQDELERCAALLHSAALYLFMGREEEAQRIAEALPAWAVDDLHLAVVDTYARAGRSEEARAYANGLPDGALKLECFLRLLEHSDDRLTRIRAQSMLTLNRVPRSYALRLAKRTRASVDLERAEALVWQDLDDGSSSAALALVELGELLLRPKEAERARELLRRADASDPTAQACATRLGALWAQLQLVPDALLRELPAGLRGKAAQGLIPGLARAGETARALELVAEIQDPVAATSALAEAATVATPSKERSSPRIEAPLRDRTPARPTPIPAAPAPSSELELESRTNLRARLKGEEPTPAPGPLADPLLALGNGPEEDDSTVEGRRRRPSAGLASLLNEVPDSIPVRPETQSEPPPAAPRREPTSEGWLRGRLESKTPAGERLKSRDDSTPRPESALEQARRFAARAEEEQLPAVWRTLWTLTQDPADLTEARSAAEGNQAALSSLGEAFARAGLRSEAQELARSLPDGELRGVVLAALAKERARQGDLAHAEAEVLATNHYLARALVLLEVAEPSPSLDRIEDVAHALSQLQGAPEALVHRAAALYARAGRPARALALGGDAARLPVARRLAQEGRRDEAARYLEALEDPIARASGHIALVVRGQEDAFFVQALASLDAIEPKKRLSSALALAKASGRTADASRARLLAERLLPREDLSAMRDLLALWEIGRERPDLDALIHLLRNPRAKDDPHALPVLRQLAPILLQEDTGGRQLLEWIDSLQEPSLRAAAAEAAARAFAKNAQLELAVRAARLSPSPAYSAYGLLAVAAALRNVPSPYEYPAAS